MESDKPELQVLQPLAGEYNQIQAQIKHFQEQVGTLRAMAQAARQQTLQSIRESVLQKGMAAFQESDNSPKKLNSPMEDQQNQSQEATIISNAQEALEYTDLHMAQIIDSMRSQVEMAMNAAKEATLAGSNVINEAVKQSTKAMQTQSIEEAQVIDSDAQDQELLSQMQQAEQNVVNSIGQHLPGTNQ